MGTPPRALPFLLTERTNKNERGTNSARQTPSVQECCLALGSLALHNGTKAVHNQVIGRAMKLFAGYKHKVNPAVYLTRSLFKCNSRTTRYAVSKDSVGWPSRLRHAGIILTHTYRFLVLQLYINQVLSLCSA
jgi:hypothetical protein